MILEFLKPLILETLKQTLTILDFLKPLILETLKIKRSGFRPLLNNLYFNSKHTSQHECPFQK